MSTLELKRDLLMKARTRCNLNEADRAIVEEKLKDVGPSIHTLDVQLPEFPLGYWKAILDDSRLTTNQRAVIARYVFGMNGRLPGADGIYRAETASPVEFGSTFAMLGQKSPNAELHLNGRWYPVIVECHFTKDELSLARDVYLRYCLSLCDTAVTRHYAVSRDLFVDAEGHATPRTVAEVLEMLGLRELQTPPAEYNLRLVKAERLARETATMVQVAGAVFLQSEEYWNGGLMARNVGSPASPTIGIIEPELEINEHMRSHLGVGGNGESASRLPFVRLFSLEIKRYVYADVDDLLPYEFDPAPMDSLCLPAEMISVLNRVFDSPPDRVFGDLIRGKHGGVVILASGPPGVGKTLTAEIYAERTERPLYVLEIGELGVNAQQVESQLREVFARVTRWNAVLQFDECEIFLSHRNDDLERSAIVGIFLRLLDYYQGLLFLTSNRPETIDAAVLSRVMLHLRYPPLNASTRERIWRRMFAAAGLELVDDGYFALADRDLNGRQIRNLTRLAKMLYGAGRVTLAQMDDVFRYGAV